MPCYDPPSLEELATDEILKPIRKEIQELVEAANMLCSLCKEFEAGTLVLGAVEDKGSPVLLSLRRWWETHKRRDKEKSMNHA